jgi:hypothetical protein
MATKAAKKKTRAPKTPKQPFILKIQPKVLAKRDAQTFMRLLREYIDRTGMPPMLSSSPPVPGPSPVPLPTPTPTPTPTPAPSGTLSNCRDTETECTCDWDD